ncbi:MAG: hypothetical protein IPK68_23520 [Bdellovibrionales bacterium]|nr:hypothetical protein [Bdellovibrionales bacterium]
MAFPKDLRIFWQAKFSKEFRAPFLILNEVIMVCLRPVKAHFYKCPCFSHYLNGAYYPVGTSQAIPQAVASTVKEGGGDVRVRHEVKDLVWMVIE